MSSIFGIMPCRIKSYQATLDGFKLTNHHLVAYNDVCNNGANILMPAGYADDIGSYFFVPYLSNLLSLNVELTAKIFFSLYGLIALTIALFGINKLYTNKKSKIYGFIHITLLALLFIYVGDNYSFYGSTCIMLIPLWLILINTKKINLKNLILLSLFTGLIIGFSNIVRSHSGTSVLLSILIFFIFSKKIKKNILKIFSILIICMPIFIINLSFDYLKNKRAELLELDKYKIKLIERGIETNNARAMWHNFYYSLGYLYSAKEYYPQANDTNSLKKAQSIEPNIVLFSKKYENLLRKEYFSFILNNPMSYFETMAAKAGVIIFYIIIFTNISLLIFIKHKKINTTFYFFLVGIIFNSLFGIMATPEYSYLLGLFAYCVFFNINYYNLYRNKNILNKI
jgi:hypothetical protein